MEIFELIQLMHFPLGVYGLVFGVGFSRECKGNARKIHKSDGVGLVMTNSKNKKKRINTLYLSGSTKIAFLKFVLRVNKQFLYNQKYEKEKKNDGVKNAFS